MAFGIRSASSRSVRLSGSLGKADRGTRRRAVSQAVKRGIEQLEQRLLMSSGPLAAPLPASHALSVNFSGGGNGQAATLVDPTSSAGFFPATNFNNAGGGAGTNVPLLDSSGAATGALLTYTSGGTYASHAGQITPGNGDSALNEGFIFGNASVSVKNIPFSHYTVYIYELNDASGRVETTTSGGVSFYGASANPADGSHVNTTDTPYLYTQSSSTDPANPTSGGDYVEYDAQTASTFTFTNSAPGNGYLNGFQIVDSPVAAPPAPVLAAPTVGNNVVSLTWSGVDSYTFSVFRSDPAHPTPVALVSNIGGNSFTDNTAVNGTTYTYFVTGTNPIGNSPSSNTQPATPQPIAPAAPTLSAALVAPATAQLNWNAPQFAASFDVKRGTAPGGPFTTLISGLTTPGYVDATATGNGPYFYIVTATNGGGTSPNSNAAFVATGVNTIGVNFTGGGNGGSVAQPLAPTDTAGVYPASHYNNLDGSTATNLPLHDYNGAIIGAGTTMTVTSPGTYGSANGAITPATADQILNDGFIYGDSSVTLNNIPFSHYDVYVYELNDASGRVETTTANGVSYYGASATPTDADHVSGAPNTYLYTQTTSTDVNNPTPNGDWVLFSAQTGSTFTFTTTAPGNGYLNGFEIVNHPIVAPTAPVLAAPVVNDAFVRLTWTSPDGVNFTVMRSDPGHPAAAVATNITSTSFVDTTVTNGIVYSYFVIASNPYGTSGNSNTQTASPQPIAPAGVSNIVVARTNPTTVVLTWTGAEFSSSYTIKRSTTLGGTFTTIASGVTTQTYTDTTANTTGNVDYFYTITPVNTGGPGVVSPVNFVGHGTGFTGDYYSAATAGTAIKTGDDPASVLGFVRTDPGINITGSDTVPVPNAPATWNTIEGANTGDDFAVRWTGYLEAPVSGYYTLLPSSDDGIQVLIFDPITQALVVLQPSSINVGRGVTEDSVAVKDSAGNPFAFTAGQKYLVQIDYNQGGGGWGAAFRWAASSTPAFQAAHTYDALSRQFVPSYDVVPPTPTFATVDSTGVVAKDQAYYTFTGAGLRLKWSDIGADSYNIYRSTSPNGPFTKINTAPILAAAGPSGGMDTYLDTDSALVSGTSYTYIVTGVNGSGETPINLATGLTGGLTLTTTPVFIPGTAASEFIYVTQDPNTFGQIDWWVRNTPFTSSPVGTTPTGTIMNSSFTGPVTVFGKGGTDTITLDLTNGDFRADQNLPVTIANPTPVGTTLALVGSGFGDTLQIDPNGISPSGVTGTYFQTGGTAVFLDVAAGADGFKLSGALNGSATVNVFSGNYRLDANTPSGPAAVGVNLFGAAAGITLAANQHLQSLIVNNGGVATIGGVVDLDILSIDATSKVNVNNTLNLDYTGSTILPSILPFIVSGRNGGTWDGLGIDSSNAHASNGTGALGYSDNGTSVVTVKYTRNGDANLNGTTDFADLVAVAQHYGLTGGQTWATGDFNYDGNVDFADLVTVAQNYGQSLPAAPVEAPAPAAPVFAPAVSAPAVSAPAASAPVAAVPAKAASITAAPKVAVVAKPIIAAKPVTVAKPVIASKPVAVSKAPSAPVKTVAKASTAAFAPMTQFRVQNQTTGVLGDVLEKKQATAKSLFR